jgi:hypothetical protein
MKQNLQNIMEKEMSRKEFLGLLSFGLASIFGLSTILRLLGRKSPLHDSPSSYGSSVYGGSR